MTAALDYRFSYNLSKRYPFERFTGIVIIVLSLLFAFFSVFNVAVNGYTLQPVYTTDPNTTLSRHYWFNNIIFAWGSDKLTPKCTGQAIPIGSQFFTTNGGLAYNLRTVQRRTEVASDARRESSITYLNNTLNNCHVNRIDVYMRKADRSSPPSGWWSWLDSSAKAEAQCDIANQEGIFTIKFDMSYTQQSGFDYVITNNYTTHASMWWGTYLLNNYFNGMQNIMALLPADIFGADAIAGQFTYTRNTTLTNSIKDYRLFDLYYWLLDVGGEILNAGWDGNGADQIYNNPEIFLAPPLTEGLSFAKILYSLILVDLGMQNNQTSNILLDPELLQNALNPDDDFNRQGKGNLTRIDGLDWWRFNGIPPPDQPVLPRWRKHGTYEPNLR